MNKKFKVGDIVVLVEEAHLNDLETILAKEKHLFEVTGPWGYTRIRLKSISTDLITVFNVDHIRHAVRMERDLVYRDIPMKVIKEVDKKYVDLEDFYERDIYRCSNCNNVLIIDRYQSLDDRDKINYCKECGQRLDWSE